MLFFTLMFLIDYRDWTYLLEKDVTRLEVIVLPETEIDNILKHVTNQKENLD